MQRVRFFAWNLLAVSLLALANSSAQAKDNWVATWGASMMKAPPAQVATLGTEEQTIRSFVHLSLGGDQIRLVISNEFGAAPLQLGGVTVAAAGAAPGYGLQPPVRVLFQGKPNATIAPGGVLRSDPVPIKVPAMADLAVSIDLPKQALDGVSEHAVALASNLIAPGKQDSATTLTGGVVHTSVFFLRGIEVNASSKKAAAIVTLGDSITDGTRSTVDANRRYPDDLSRRLQANHVTRDFAVIDEGIAGNRVLHDGVGPSAVARFDRDVLAVPGVKYVVLLEGINDISRSHVSQLAEDKVTADQIIAGYKDMIARAHKAGLKIIGATLTPYEGFKQAVPETIAMVKQVNEFIRHGGQFDGFFDFEAAVKDPAEPGHFLPANDSGDHLHPSDAGYQAMADSIDLPMFK